MRPDVVRAQSPEHGVADRVQQGVGVRVSLQAALEGNRDTTEHQPPPGDQRMHIETVADADVRHRSRYGAASSGASAPRMAPGTGVGFRVERSTQTWTK